MIDKPGCIAPRLGEAVSARLGAGLSTELAEHVRGCLGCQAERAAFEIWQGADARPSRALAARVYWDARRALRE